MDFKNVIGETMNLSKRNKIIKAFARQWKMLQRKCISEFSIEIIEDPEGDLHEVGGYAVAMFDNFKHEPYALVIGWLYSMPKFIVERIIAAAHEMGHFRDMKDVGYKEFAAAYNSFYSRLQLEYRAWVHAVDILREIGFDQWEAVLFVFDKAFLSYCDMTDFLPEDVVPADPQKLLQDYRARLVSVIGTKELAHDMA